MGYFRKRVTIIEDNDEIREGYSFIINSLKNYYVINAYTNCEDALKNLTKDHPDIVIMDLELPGMTGIEGTFEIKKLRPTTDIIVNTVFESNKLVFDALCAGATGYLTKNSEDFELIKALDTVSAGGAPMSTHIAKMVVSSFQINPKSPLTTRETEVLKLVAEGKSYSTIAKELFIAKETAKTHIKNIYNRLHVNNKADAIAQAKKDRLI